MENINENLSELSRRNMEAAMKVAQLSFENSQRIMALQNELARELFQDGAENARALSATKDPQELLKLRNDYAQATTRKMISAAQKVSEIGGDVRAEFSRTLTSQMAAGSQEIAEAFQGLFKNMPGQQNSTMAETMSQAMSAASSAFEQVAQTANSAFAGMATPKKDK